MSCVGDTFLLQKVIRPRRLRNYLSPGTGGGVGLTKPGGESMATAIVRVGASVRVCVCVWGGVSMQNAITGMRDIERRKKEIK